MLLIIVAALALIAQTLLSLVVLLKDSRGLRNRAFFLLSLALLLWAAINFASEAFPQVAKNIFAIRSIMFFVVLQNCFFALFGHALNEKRLTITKWTLAYIGLTILVAIATMTPIIFSELAPTPRGNLFPVAQPGMGLFVLHATISVIVGFRLVGRAYRHSIGTQHQQMLYILLGSIVLWGIVPLTNFALSITLQTSFFSNLSPLYAFIFSTLIAYAIIKHRLFDIRLAIARTLTYLLLLVTLVFSYAAIVFAAISLLFGKEQQIHLAQGVVYVGAAVFLAFTFEPLRRFFRRLTNALFFQDAYDTKLVLDKITSVVVRIVAVNKLAKQSLTILSDALKSEHAAIVILNNAQPGNIQHVITIGRRRANLNTLMPELEHHAPALLLADDIESESDLMHRTMQKSNVAAIAQLKTTKDSIGYILFGYKESGNVYTAQDAELIRIAADELSVAIQNALRFEQIEHFNETLQHEIHEATKQLRQNNKKLLALDEAKDEFISMASHQLRTPLTSVKGYLSMALEGDVGELKADQRRLLQEAYASAQRMVYMISDFLNISRLKTGKFLLESSTVHLPGIIQEEIEQLVPAARGRGITIKTHISPNFPALQLDENKIHQVIMNFIDNAIFYSKSGGTVLVSLDHNSKEISFTVEDHGIGVPKDEQKNIFTKFFRATNARHVRPDGTGVGLFMANKIVDAHGGSMIFKTEENKGSTFGFHLPVKTHLKGDSKKFIHQPTDQ